MKSILSTEIIIQILTEFTDSQKKDIEWIMATTLQTPS